MATNRPVRVPRRLRSGAYLLPSAFTIGNMLLGFYAVVCGVRGAVAGDPGLFQRAALLVFVAGILDGLDGRIARLTGTESDFGREYDSLADVLTFGLAPALLAWLWGLGDLGRIGWLVPLFFLVCTATRLARFNVQIRVVDSRAFVGLPTPAAAGSIGSLIFLFPDPAGQPWLLGLMVGSLVAIGALMVSTFRFSSFKQFDLRRRWSYRALLLVAAVILVVAVHPPAFFLAVAVPYILSGPLGWLWGKVRPAGAEQAAEGSPGAGPADPPKGDASPQGAR